jgi:hypothetical protein
MAVVKYTCPPLASGENTFSDNLVGLQIVNGGGLTNSNFEFQVQNAEKVNRVFSRANYSTPQSLESIGIKDLAQSVKIIETNFTVYPNFDLTDINSFVNYGPLSKRFSSAVLNIINYFPAALEVDKFRYNFSSGSTAFNINYDEDTQNTSFSILVTSLRNPFNIDFSVNSTQNISSYTYEVSEFRNLKRTFTDYVLDYKGNFYEILNFTPSQSLTSGTITFLCDGDPFSGESITYEHLVIRPNDVIVNKVFNLNLDEVEEFLLNRYVIPKYTSQFSVPEEGDDGNLFLSLKNVTWKLDGYWNIDIRTSSFDDYLQTLNTIAEDFDLFKTNLVSRFYVTDSIQEFDTPDQKVDKVLKIYGRSFDESKKYIDAIKHMTSINYNIGNDVPSKLLVNICQTLGWNTNISPITSSNLIESLYGVSTNTFPGYSLSQTLEDLQYQYYRNLILNSAYFFKSKGTRRGVDFIMNLIGTPEAIYEFNENIYVVDGRISKERFNELYSLVSGGTYSPTFPAYNPENIYLFNGVQYTGYTSSTVTQDVTIVLDDYPVDSNGYPKPPNNTANFYFQKGAGWYQSTAQHRSPEVINRTLSTFTGQNLNVQTQLEPFTYGGKYLDRFVNFPYLGYGFTIRKQIDNKKSWAINDSDVRISNTGGFNSYYYVEDDKFTLNVKNTEVFLNPAQGLEYDVWYLSRTKNYPIPSTGLTSPYPIPGGIDSTFINPKPQNDTFFEFKETYWKNMINVRNRQYSSDGKTSGYPTLESIYWKYSTMYNDVGIQNNNFTYDTMIQYIEKMGTYWIKLVEQSVPATTLWNTGTKITNSNFHRQKFVYRRQTGTAQPTAQI